MLPSSITSERGFVIAPEFKFDRVVNGYQVIETPSVITKSNKGVWFCEEDYKDAILFNMEECEKFVLHSRYGNERKFKIIHKDTKTFFVRRYEFLMEDEYITSTIDSCEIIKSNGTFTDVMLPWDSEDKFSTNLEGAFLNIKNDKIVQNSINRRNHIYRVKIQYQILVNSGYECQ